MYSVIWYPTGAVNNISSRITVEVSHRETLIGRLAGILTGKVELVQYAISAILIVSLAVSVTLTIIF